MITRIQFTNIHGAVDMESPAFTSPTEAQEERFLDEFMGEDSDDPIVSELFWQSDFSSHGDTMIVDWLHTALTHPPQVYVDLIAKELGVAIPAYNTWVVV